MYKAGVACWCTYSIEGKWIWGREREVSCRLVFIPGDDSGGTCDGEFGKSYGMAFCVLFVG